MDEKYIVFKKEEWDSFRKQFRPTSPPLPVEDAVVIRRQDMFAPPALDAYANAITVALTVLSEADGGADIYDAEIPKKLRDVADYFHEQAKLAWDLHRKIPD